ncbi:MAG: 30S ribosomal protein S6 [Candidatus Pacebacteria bacterium]|nr:30S ribosomal protein S6 [Candidatus Paceibacterota bacterium]
MRDYELVLITKTKTEAENEAVLKSVKELILSFKGKVNKTSPWGKRDLVYPIKQQRSGYYFLLQIKLSPESIKEFEKKLKLNENVIRYLLITRG